MLLPQIKHKQPLPPTLIHCSRYPPESLDAFKTLYLQRWDWTWHVLYRLDECPIQIKSELYISQPASESVFSQENCAEIHTLDCRCQDSLLSSAIWPAGISDSLDE